MKVLVVHYSYTFAEGRGSSLVERQTPYERSRRVRTPQPLCSVLKLPQSTGKYPNLNLTEKVFGSTKKNLSGG